MDGRGARVQPAVQRLELAGSRRVVRANGALSRQRHHEATMLSTLLLVVLVLLLVGAIPSWPHSRSWGYGPSGILGVVLIVVLVLALAGRV